MKAKKTKSAALLFQAAVCFAAALACGVLRPLNWIHWPAKWLALPLLGAVTAFRDVRRGINPYAAWILPPVMATLAAALISLGYAPDMGNILLLALISLVGAATGDVANRTGKKSKGKQK